MNIFYKNTFLFLQKILKYFKKSFTSSISYHTNVDGSDVHIYLEKLFKVLKDKNRNNYPEYFIKFPYVNGGLFENDYKIPKFTKGLENIS